MELDARIASESRRGDVLYTERRRRPEHRRKLGMLGELARGRVLFELFRNPPTLLELQSCVLKAVDLTAREARRARREKQPPSSVEGPTLCVITPSMSAEYAERAGAAQMSSGQPGHYALASIWRTIIVVANELPKDRSTLWLRLLGRGAVQEEAVRELLELGEQEPLRDATLRLLVAWQQSLPPLAQQSEDERELAMNLERIYERWERKVEAQGYRKGKAEGKAEAKAEAVLAVLEGRGFAITTAQRKHVLACTDSAELDAWLRAAGTAPSVKALLSGAALPRSREKGRGKAP